MTILSLLKDLRLERGNKHIHKTWRMGITFSVEMHHAHDEVKERLILTRAVGRGVWSGQNLGGWRNWNMGIRGRSYWSHLQWCIASRKCTMHAHHDWAAMPILPIGKRKIRRTNWAKLDLTLDVRLKEFSSEQGQDFVSFILRSPVHGGEVSN